MSQIIYFIEDSGYNKYVVNAGLEEDDVWFPSDFSSAFIRTLFKFHFAWPLNKKRDAPCVSLWFRFVMNGIVANPDEEVYILMAESYHLSYSRSFLNYLRKKYPLSKLAFIFTNPVGRYNLCKLNDLKTCYDQIITFNYDDSIKYDFNYCGVMPYKLPDNIKSDYPKTDIFFIGSDKGRLNKLIEIYNELTKLNLNCEFYINGVAPEKQVKLPGVVYNKRITYEEVLKHVKSSKCVLEVLQDKANYVSIRTMEALQLQRKLITTSNYSMQEPFYDSDIILVWGSSDSYADFLNKDIEDSVYRNLPLNTDFKRFKEYLYNIFNNGK